MKKVILYVRVSTDEQAEKGYSQRSQEETLTRFCEINRYTIVSIFTEDHSAKTFDRPQFNKLLLQVRKHKNSYDLVLFTKWDRFSRNAGDAYQMIGILNKLGIEPQAVEQPLDLEVPENKMMLAFYLAAPEVENDRRALNVISGQRRAQKEGRFMNKAPFGYINRTRDNDSKYIEPSDKAPVVQWVFDQLATGKFSAESIYQAARNRGFHLKKNAYWQMLRNPIYTGKIKVKAFRDEKEFLVDGQHEAIISDSLFHQVQYFLDGRKKLQCTSIAAHDKFPLRGHLKCSNDNRMLTASSSKGRKQYYDYYHCTSSCGVRYKAAIAHEAMIRELAKWKPHPAIKELYKLILKDIYSQHAKARTQEIHSIKEEITRLTNRLNKARDLMLSDSIDPDDFKAIKKEAELGIIKQEQLFSDIATITDIQPMIDSGIEVLSNIDQLYITGSSDYKKKIIGSMFPDKLEFDGEHYRTARVNEAVRLIFSIGAAFEEKEKGQEQGNVALSSLGYPLIRFSNLFIHDLKKLAALVA